MITEKPTVTQPLKAEACHCYDGWTAADWQHYYPCNHRQDLQHHYRAQVEHDAVERLAS